MVRVKEQSCWSSLPTFIPTVSYVFCPMENEAIWWLQRATSDQCRRLFCTIRVWVSTNSHSYVCFFCNKQSCCICWKQTHGIGQCLWPMPLWYTVSVPVSVSWIRFRRSVLVTWCLGAELCLAPFSLCVVSNAPFSLYAPFLIDIVSNAPFLFDIVCCLECAVLESILSCAINVWSFVESLPSVCVSCRRCFGHAGSDEKIRQRR